MKLTKLAKHVFEVVDEGVVDKTDEVSYIYLRQGEADAV
ncbi:chlorohydrolase [Streptococcus pneumoniae]|nr:chlorohydrolase [Streptococcus pneumoniae]